MSLNFRSSLSMGLFAWLIIAICSSVDADKGGKDNFIVKYSIKCRFYINPTLLKLWINLRSLIICVTGLCIFQKVKLFFITKSFMNVCTERKLLYFVNWHLIFQHLLTCFRNFKLRCTYFIFLKLCPIFVGPTMCFWWQNQANFVPPSYKLHNPHHPNPIRWLCQFTGTLNDFLNFSIIFFFLQMTKKTISVINWMRWLKIWANLQNKRRMIK